MMAKTVSAAQAKAHLSELVANVAHQGQHYVIERRGNPVAALVPVEELEMLERGRPTSGRPCGALALAGAWQEVDEGRLDNLLAEIYAERNRDTGRPVEIDY